MNIDKDIKELEWSQSQMRLGNLPSYSQAHYKAIENTLSELETYKKIAKRLAKEILSIHHPMFNMVTVNNMEILIESARKEVENEQKQ
jgi:hypothetical protein